MTSRQNRVLNCLCCLLRKEANGTKSLSCQYDTCTSNAVRKRVDKDFSNRPSGRRCRISGLSRATMDEKGYGQTILEMSERALNTLRRKDEKNIIWCTIGESGSLSVMCTSGKVLVGIPTSSISPHPKWWIWLGHRIFCHLEVCFHDPRGESSGTMIRP